MEKRTEGMGGKRTTLDGFKIFLFYFLSSNNKALHGFFSWGWDYVSYGLKGSIISILTLCGQQEGRNKILISDLAELLISPT